ncbi:uncharacterized protein itgb3bp [Lampris incognitus]|uniref:uncharacterized protein itgb3bp n=1 Tax=Lampris incognitus TaxID=2546036 RepID=UPI0024B5802D|nr:uncharacterized protein itgb3bp [Lampris incognitus]
MPARRALHMDGGKRGTPSKIPAHDTDYSPRTGTAILETETGHAMATTQIQQIPLTDFEKWQSLRFKLESSLKSFFKARQELEEIVSAESSSELRSFFTRGSADFRTELKRHSELISRAESCLKRNYVCQNSSQEDLRKGSSYEFLKSIVG